MSLKKSYCLLLVLLLMPLVLVGVVQSVAPPTISVNLSSYGIYVYGSGWTANAPVIIYYDVEDVDHMVATVTANYAGNFQTYIPTNYVATVGVHTVIAVQGANKATAKHDVGVASPPDDRLLNPILNINNFLQNDIKADLQSIKNTLAQPLEVTNPPGESLAVSLDEPIDVTLDEPIEVTNPSGGSLDVEVKNTLDVSGWLHTTQEGYLSLEDVPNDGNWHTLCNIDCRGYDRINFRIYTNRDTQWWVVFDVDGNPYPGLEGAYDEGWTWNADWHELNYDIMGSRLLIRIANLESDPANVHGMYYMTT